MSKRMHEQNSASVQPYVQAEAPAGVPVVPATKEDFPYTRTFNAIAAAARLANGGTAIGISVQAFIDAWNAHPTSGVNGPEGAQP